MGYFETLSIIAGINILFVMSLYIVMSTGQLSVGQGGFFAIGAYVMGISTMIWNMSFLKGFILSALVPAIIAFFLSLPLLRLTHFYFAIATIAFGEVVRVFFLNFNYQIVKNGMLVGPQGPLGFRPISYLADHGISRIQFLGIVYLVVVICLIFFIMIKRSMLGASFRAVNEDETKANILGMNVTYIKISAFVFGGLIAGMAGAFNSLFLTAIRPDYFGFSFSFFALICLTFGGYETVYGAIVGAVFLTLLPEWIRFIKEYRMMLYGVLLIIMIIFRPKGLIDEDLLSKVKVSLFRKKGNF